MRVCATFACVVGLAALTAAPAAAGQRWGGTLGGGIVLPQDVSKDKLNRGWNLASGSTRPMSRSVAILTEVMYNRFSVADSVLRDLQVPEGHSRIFAGTVSFVLGPGASGPGFYVVAGTGIYNRKIEFSKPTVGGVVIFDPWLGTAVPIVVPAGEKVASFSTTKPGVNGGAGISLGKTSRVYLEARYHWIFTDNVKTTFIPINFGFRW